MYFLYFAVTLWLCFLFFACGLDAFEWKIRGGHDMEWFKNCGYRRALAGGKDEPEEHQLPATRRKAVRALKWWCEGYHQGVMDRRARTSNVRHARDSWRWRTAGGLTEKEYERLEELNSYSPGPCPISREEWDRVKTAVYSVRLRSGR